MGKDNTILMVGLGIAAGYLLLSQKGTQAVGGGDGGGFNIPGFPGWGSLVKIPGFPGWDKLIPEVDVPGFPEVPAFPGWDKFFGGIGIPTPEEVVDIVTDPAKAATGWIPTPEAIKAMIETYLGGMNIPNPLDLIPDNLIPEVPDQKSGDQRTFTEKLFGLSHNEEKGVWDRWVMAITKNYPITGTSGLTEEITGKEPTFWEKIKGSLFSPQYVYGKGYKTESPGDSELNYPSYEPRGTRDPDPDFESPRSGMFGTTNPAISTKRYTAYKGGKKVGIDLSSAMRYGGGT